MQGLSTESWSWSWVANLHCINRTTGPFIHNKQGIRQGDPISLLWFNLAVDALCTMLSEAREVGHLTGVVAHLIPNGISRLQYTDDTLLLFEPDQSSMARIRTLPIFFEAMSGLKINYTKSNVVTMGISPDEGLRAVKLLDYKLVDFPMVYLGLTASEQALASADYDPTVGKVGYRVEPWQGKLMSLGARLALTNACHLAIPFYAMGFVPSRRRGSQAT